MLSVSGGRIFHFGALFPKKPSLASKVKGPASGASGGPLGGRAVMAATRSVALQRWMPIIACRSLSRQGWPATLLVIAALVKGTVVTWGRASKRGNGWSA